MAIEIDIIFVCAFYLEPTPETWIIFTLMDIVGELIFHAQTRSRFALTVSSLLDFANDILMDREPKTLSCHFRRNVCKVS